MDRTPTGIEGFDKLIEGGLPRNSLTLLSGKPGTGKTHFSGTFLLEGAKNGENGVFVTFVEPKEQLIETLQNIDRDFSEYEENIKVLEMAPGEQLGAEMITEEVLDAIRDSDAKRVVIDSMNIMTSTLTNTADRRSLVSVLYRVLQRLGCTTLAVAEILSGGRLQNPGVLELVANGIVRLDFDYLDDEIVKKLWIEKMKSTNHTKRSHEYEITDEGIRIIS